MFQSKILNARASDVHKATEYKAKDKALGGKDKAVGCKANDLGLKTKAEMTSYMS